MTRHKAPNGAARAFVEQAAIYSDDDCLLWPYGRSTDGYGNYRGRLAHRAVYELAVGQPPDPSLVAAHAPLICHNRACVNPRHLRWATRAENTADQIFDGTRIHGARNGRAKLTASDVAAIRTSSGARDVIAQRYGIGSSYVSQLRAGRRWTHLHGDTA